MRLKLAGVFNFCIFISLCVGIVLGYYILNFHIALVFSAVFLILIYLFYRKKNIFFSDICIVIFLIFLGAALVGPSARYKKDDFLKRESIFYFKVASLPKHYANKNTVFVEVKRVGDIPVKFKVQAMDFTKKLSYLDSYRIKAKLSRMRYEGRAFYRLWIKSDTKIEKMPMSWLDRFRRKTTDYFLRVFKERLNPQAYRFLSSVFLGRRELLGEEKTMFSDIGVSHLLAISGLHIGLTSLILFFILRMFSMSFRTALGVSVVFLFAYTFITGVSSSTFRASIMYGIFAAGFFMKRKTDPLNSLGLAGIICLLINPLSLFEVGFQLSFFSVFAIISGFRLFPVKFTKNTVLCYIEGIFFSSLFVTVMITPVVSYYFGKVYILSIIYNIILIPFFTAILMINFIFIIFSPFAIFAQAIGLVLSILIDLFYSLIQFLSAIKISYVALRFSTLGIVVYYAVLAAVIVSIKYIKDNMDKRRHFYPV